MSPRAATMVGFVAILLWSMLAVLTLATKDVPPFQLMAMTFAIGVAANLAVSPSARRVFKQGRPRWTAWLLGVGGLFGYHALYFLALRTAPPAEAGLLNYLWPLLIVLLSSLLPGERMQWHHGVGALLGFAGTIILVAGNLSANLNAGQIAGLGAALAAAFVWAGYSVLSRRFSDLTSAIVVFYCAETAALALLVHWSVETTVWPDSPGAWLAIAALGAGPVGAAFFAWDIGMKRGDIRVLGAASYATPVLSTSFLIVGGYAQLTASVGLAALLIVGGGLIAAKDMLRRPSPPRKG